MTETERQATQVKCPECGASLRVAGDAAVAKCEYCGTESRIQRRAGIFQRRVALPPPAPDEPQRVASQVRSTWRLMMPIIGFNVAIGAVVLGIYLHQRRQVDWREKAPMVIDVDHDGVDDFIGIVRYSNVSHDVFLRAVSGKDGRTLWETDAIGSMYKNHWWIPTGGAILHGDNDGAYLAAFALTTGAQEWRITLDEVPASVCAGDAPGAVVLVLRDQRVYDVSLAHGDLALRAATPTCRHLLHDGSVEGTGGTVRDQGPAPTIAGMKVESVYARGDGLRIARGARAPGTAVPMLAGIDAGGAVHWRVDVPGHDPLGATQLDAVEVTDTDVVAAYGRGNGAPSELTVFDRATGRRRFERALGDGGTAHVVVSRDAVGVSISYDLRVYDLATGEPRFTVGR